MLVACVNEIWYFGRMQNKFMIYFYITLPEKFKYLRFDDRLSQIYSVKISVGMYESKDWDR
jgi:hypothetical protein